MKTQVLSWLLLISLFQILFVFQVSSQCLDDQRLSLLQLKSSLVYDSQFSTKLVNWRQSVDCCTWDGVVCDSSGHVISLELENESISGGIENLTGLFRLQRLEKLNLAFNIFNGTLIPNGLQNLTNLAYLDLSYAGFGGTPNLKMPFQNLTRLTELYLDGVHISAQTSDWCQALSSSPNLMTLSLRSTALSGPLDSCLSQLHSLSALRLDANNLSTIDPDFFANFSNLTTLTLSHCFLQGTFPDLVFRTPALQTLDISSNELLSGTIHEFPMNSSLRTIVLSHTNFSGTLPDSISNLRMLSSIDLSFCNFTGKIPSTIANLTELIYLDFSFNSFTGLMPHFSTSKKLVHVNLANNSFSGSIPTYLFGLPSLQYLQLSNNKFSGQIDEFSTSNSSRLNTLDLSSNKLGGSLPKSFIKLERLSVLSLSSNFFNRSLKLEIFRNLRNLSSLELGHNNLSVDTSQSNSSLSQFPQLSRLNLASCNLAKFPDLRNQYKLGYLDLSNNHIKGEIPSWIWNIGDRGVLAYLNLSYNLLVDFQEPCNVSPSLSVIDLHSNRLQGQVPLPPETAAYVDYSSNNFQQSIPTNIFNSGIGPIFLSLANNSLTGTIPASFCNLVYLQVLDLSVNNLSGSIPPCLIENITSLGVLNLRRNNLTGDIPDKFPVNCRLQTLELSDNNLRGKFPPSMANCKFLEVMNIGDNKIDDTFPCNLENASNLRVLVLRNNKFHGDLSCSRFDMGWINLQIIDIASNNFRGEPSAEFIASWRGMVLDNDAQLRGNQLRFNFLKLNNFYYQNAVTVTNKGLQMELEKILTIFTVINLSYNNFTGEIPMSVLALPSLYVLNLSHNSFTGEIPSSIGNLKQLGSLDLSGNQLTGEIPHELAGLTFLAFLNLSYNKLVGEIPTGSQFPTFSEESFAGNSMLCGFPSNTICGSNGTLEKSETSTNPQQVNWELMIGGWGYVVGITLFFVSLVFCDKWREQFNRQVDEFLDLILPRR